MAAPYGETGTVSSSSWFTFQEGSASMDVNVSAGAEVRCEGSREQHFAVR